MEINWEDVLTEHQTSFSRNLASNFYWNVTTLL